MLGDWFVKCVISVAVLHRQRFSPFGVGLSSFPPFPDTWQQEKSSQFGEDTIYSLHIAGTEQQQLSKRHGGDMTSQPHTDAIVQQELFKLFGEDMHNLYDMNWTL
jgi:hypothetical protein